MASIHSSSPTVHPRQTFFRMAKTSLVGLCIGVFVVALGLALVLL